MSSNSIGRASVWALLASAFLTACASSSTSATPGPSAAATSSPASTNPASSATLTSGELPGAASSLTQASDGLLGGTPNTNARVFANGDRSVAMEIDAAVATSAGAALTDYASYAAAAAKMVTTQTSTKPLPTGTKAVEYVGTGSRGQNVVTIALLQNNVICVITYDSTSSPNPSAAESVASAQVAKIQGVGH